MARRAAASVPTAEAGLGHLHWGDDAWQMQEAQQALITSVVDPDWGMMNLMRQSGGTVAEALAAARTPPFGQGGRLVIVSLTADEAQSFIEELAEIWDAGPPLRGNALLVEAPSLDRRRKAVKHLESRLSLRSFVAPKPWEAAKTLGPWIDARLADRGASMAPDARQALIDAVGTDTVRLAGELEKLLIWSQGARIERAAVMALVAATDADVFGLLACLAAGDRGGALMEAQALLREARELPKLVGGLAANLLLIKRAKQLLSAGQSQADAAAWLGVHPFRLQNLLSDWRRWQIEDVRSAVAALTELDRRSKSSAWPAASLLEVWICRFPHGWANLPPVSLV